MPMLRSTCLSLFCLSIAPLLVAQTIEPEKLREDFRILRSALEEGHPGIYRYTPKAELDSVFDATAARIDRPMTALEFYRVLAPVVAALKCGHTSMGLSEELQKRAIPLFPAEVRVRRADPNRYSMERCHRSGVRSMPRSRGTSLRTHAPRDYGYDISDYY